MAGNIRYERRGRCAFVTFDRPEARNAMTWDMYEQLFDACERLDTEDDVRVAVLRGAGGKAFVAGTDIGQFTEFSTSEDGLEYEARIERIVQRLETVKVPTVAVVEGYAVGGGLSLAAVCDIRICTPDARFGIPIARTLGNCLSMAGYARLVSLLGPSRAKAMLLLAGFVPAEDAHAAGFVTEIVDRDELEDRVEALADQLSGHAPITMRVTKEAIRRLTLSGLPDGDDLVRECYGSEDFKTGVAAFLEKSTPAWQGR